MGSEDVLHFAEDDALPPFAAAGRPWTILIVDDDAAVHESTRFALHNYTLNGRGLRILSASSAQEGLRVLEREPDVAVVLLDVVMESDNAGLQLVDDIRKRLRNETVRIVLRTGQPGQAPERRVVLDYDINDYKSKTELTADKLFTTLTAALRSFEQLQRVTALGRGLSVIVETASLFFEGASLKRVSQGVIEHLEELIETPGPSLLALKRVDESWPRATVLAGSGRFVGLVGTELLRLPSPLLDPLRGALNRRRSDLDGRPAVLHMLTAGAHQVVLLTEIDSPLSALDREMIHQFCDRMSLAFDNLLLNQQIQDVNASLEERVVQRTAELSQANQQLASQRASLRRANRFKTEMLGTVAHDLKNPLGVILGRTEILNDLLAVEPLPMEQMQQQLRHIRDSAKRLTAMVNDLIVDAMHDALDISVREDMVDFACLAAEVVAANRPLAERKQQRIQLTGAPSLPLKGDQERLREAIDNLVGNAIKYSPVGGAIEVRVSRDGETAICAVRDEGPGLSPEDLGRVFGRFQRLSAKPTGGETSTGLGLSIVKRIAELHNGHARAENHADGRGAVFSVHVPLERCAE